MGGIEALDRSVPAAGQDRTCCVARNDRSDCLAASERREVAQRAGRIWYLGGGRRRPSSAGAVWASGNGFLSAPRSAAWSWAWLFSTALRSGRTTRRRGRQKRGSGAQRDVREALGRSRGGYGTKACVITDGAGRPISFALAPGQAHELPLASELVDCLPDVPGWVVGDKGYASHAFRQFIVIGARPATPAKSNEAPVACPGWIYNNRNRVKRLWARLKEWRASQPLRENRHILHGRPLPRRRLRLDQARLQAITGPKRIWHHRA